MFKNILWDFIGKFSIQISGFGISVILTRLLTPAEFGVMGMGMAVIVFAHIFLDLGFNRAIIQSKEISAEQYATIFFLNTLAAGVLTLLCYFLAGPFAGFYHQPLIAPVFRAMSALFIINGLNLVPAALLYKRLQIRLNSILTLAASLLSGLAGVAMAYLGYGIWSLVWQALLNAFLLLVLNFIYARWLPAFRFNISSIKPVWGYGSRMFASGLLDSFYTRLDIFIIGRLFLPTTLGFYTRAQSMDNFVRQLSVNSIMGALFPYIARYQDDRAYLVILYKRYLHLITFIAIALSGSLLLTAPYIFMILFTAKWRYAARLFQLMSVIGFIWPVSALMCNIIAGVGNSTAFLRLEVIKKVLFLPVYVLGFIFGLQGFLYFFIVANFIALFVNALYVSKEIDISVKSQLMATLSYFGLAAFAALATYFLHSILPFFNNVCSVLILCLLFNAIYLAGCYLFGFHAFGNINAIYQKLKTFLYDKRNQNISTPV
jgi:teichuronic acid exporter